MQVQFYSIYILVPLLVILVHQTVIYWAMQMIITISTCIDPNAKNNEQQIVGKIQNSIEKTKHWMCLNRLKINDQKTNFIMYGNNVQLAKCSTKHIKVGEETIVGSDKINLLGIDIDKNLTFKEHIKKKMQDSHV